MSFSLLLIAKTLWALENHHLHKDPIYSFIINPDIIEYIFLDFQKKKQKQINLKQWIYLQEVDTETVDQFGALNSLTPNTTADSIILT